MRTIAMIVPAWRDFPGRVIRLAAAALLISTAMTVPRATLADPQPPNAPPAASTQAP